MLDDNETINIHYTNGIKGRSGVVACRIKAGTPNKEAADILRGLAYSLDNYYE